MTVEIVAAVAAVILALVGLVGIVFPVLPGSILVGAGALIWAIWGASSWGWVAFGVAAFLLIVGATSSLLLTGRSLKQRNVPKWPVTVGILVGIIGMFVLPGFGLPIGFAVGLPLAEWYRMRDFRQAAVTSWKTIKALGLGILVEFSCAMVATSVLAVSIAAAWRIRGTGRSGTAGSPCALSPEVTDASNGSFGPVPGIEPSWTVQSVSSSETVRRKFSNSAPSWSAEGISESSGTRRFGPC